MSLGTMAHSHAGDRQLISYGTAGFRGKAESIQHLFQNVGIIAGLRCLQQGKNVGVMITASHNPVHDNGVKLIDSNGEMLHPTWESIVEQFCNLQDEATKTTKLEELIKEYQIELKPSITEKRFVMVGMDTRPSSEALAVLVKRGIEYWSKYLSFYDYGIVTTPALHFLVGESNKNQSGLLHIQTYYDRLTNGFTNLFETRDSSHDELIIDCANGVGYETLKNLQRNDKFVSVSPIKLINTGDGILNHNCGADFVKTTQKRPTGADETGVRYASLDGDADRVVYFYTQNDMKLKLLDGDKIMALYARYLTKELTSIRLYDLLTLGLVQTAYANGSSTEYMTKELGLKVDFAETGVKNLHHQAVNYDIGIYFEANGHGTIWLSQKARELIENDRRPGLDDLRNLFKMIVNYTGDAISDILVVEAILRKLNWSIQDWDNLYEDRPNALTKVEVSDRNKIKTADSSRVCVEPEALQLIIDSIVSKAGGNARCFVRPSGTEDVVRIYAEAASQEVADWVAAEVGKNVMKLC